jgi:hopanoid biosynthesis associated RND transporter like protein HpnN
LRINPGVWILEKISYGGTRYPLPTLLVALILAVGSIFYTTANLEFQTAQKDLIYPGDKLMQLSERLNEFDDLDSFVVAIENRDSRRSLQFLQALVARLEKDREHYLQVYYRVDPQQFRPWVLLYLNRKDILSLGENLKEYRPLLEGLARSPTLVNFFEQTNREMSSKMVGELFTGFLDRESPGRAQEPLNLDFLIRVLKEMNRFLEGGEYFISPWESLFTDGTGGEISQKGYFWTKNKRYLLLFITPAKKVESFALASNALGALRKTIALVQEDFPGIKAGVTGQEALNADQMSTALEDMKLATLLSLGGLTVLLVVFFRGLRRPLLEIIILLVALSLTFGLTTLFIGHLNILSVAFAPLLLGLGIDYGIHWLARYQEEEERPGALKDEVLRIITERLGPGILLAGLTAALSFFPLVLTGFKGLVELGVICSLGMVVMVFTTLALLPALIVLLDKKKPSLPPAPPPAGIKSFLGLTPRRVWGILALSGFGLVFSLWGAGKVKFDLNMLHLQSSGADSVVWEKKLLQAADFSSMYGEIVARSLAEARQKTRALENLPTVSKVESVDSLLPQDQGEKIALLRKLKPVLDGIKPIRVVAGSVNPQELERILARIRFKMLDPSHSQWGIHKPLEAQMAEVRRLIDQLRQSLHSRERSRILQGLRAFETNLIRDLRDKFDILRANVNTRPMTPEDLPRPLLQRYRGDRQLFLLRVFPREDIWEPELLGRFVGDLRSVDPEAIGDPVTLYVFTQAFRDGCIKAALYAAAFIFLLLLFTFRGFTPAFTALVPLFVGTAWTLGLMVLLGIDFNLANSPFLPLVVGAGVEYGIIILHRWRQREKGRVPLPFNTGLGVILAGLTTTVGFGSLTISDHRGIYSLGLLAAIGSLSILAAAILLLPALLQFFLQLTERRRKSPGHP